MSKRFRDFQNNAKLATFQLKLKYFLNAPKNLIFTFIQSPYLVKLSLNTHVQARRIVSHRIGTNAQSWECRSVNSVELSPEKSYTKCIYRAIQSLSFKFRGEVGNAPGNRFSSGKYVRQCSHVYLAGTACSHSANSLADHTRSHQSKR